MPVTDEQARKLGRRLLMARARILSENGFYGLLLAHMRFMVGDELDTAWVSSDDVITLNPAFAEELSNDELVFVLEHEVLHAALDHLVRQASREQRLFNIAADIVVNSNIKHSNNDDPASITIRAFGGESLHLAPNGVEGWQYTAEEVYEMLLDSKDQGYVPGPSSIVSPQSLDQAIEDARAIGRGAGWDWHIVGVGSSEDEAAAREKWAHRIRDACEAMRVRDPSNTRGLVPAGIERYVSEVLNPQADWRLLLNDFVREEVSDYTFMQPDRRMADSAYVLPGFNDTEAVVRDVLFMVDTSGSVSDHELSAAYSEIAGAIEQCKLEGFLGFFDADPYEPVPFSSVSELRRIRPKGGGGTRFEAVFEAVDRWLSAEDLAYIVILTDGWAPYPPEHMAQGVPVLWLLTDSRADEPPWGRVAKLDVR